MDTLTPQIWLGGSRKFSVATMGFHHRFGTSPRPVHYLYTVPISSYILGYLFSFVFLFFGKRDDFLNRCFALPWVQGAV